MSTSDQPREHASGAGASSPRSALLAELEFVCDLVRGCAEIALRYQAGGPKILGLRHKPLGGGPITHADREINDRITSALERRFPGDGILAEESVDDGHWRDAKRCWYVDPIDGTREFAQRGRGWTIQVGLCIDGEPVLGVVAEPGRGLLSFGVLDVDPPVSGQWVGQGRLEPLGMSRRSLAELRLIGGKLYPTSRQHAIRRALEVDLDRVQSVGSVGVRLTSVARGDADAYVQAPGRTKMWDTCAPEVLVRAAGGVVTDLVGQRLSYRGADITHPLGVVASHPADHATILRKLAPLVKRWTSRG